VKHTNFDLILLPLGNEVIDKVLQLVLVVAAPRGDGLLGSINHNITNRCLEGWPLVPTDNPGSGEDLRYGAVVNSPRARESLDPVLGCGGDSHVYQQILESTDEDCSLDPIGLPLIGVEVHLLVL
jgi:hypothetical protein